MPSDAHSLSAEIWTHIFALACTDGGYTDCSLSAVSHYFRAASKSVRYRTVALFGLDQILAYGALCEDPLSTHRAVHNLFLAKSNPQRADAADSQLLVPRPGQDIVTDTARDMENTKENNRFPASIAPILAAVAPTLRTLGLADLDFFPKTALSVPLARVEELTLFGQTNTFDWHESFCLPAVRRVHLGGTVKVVSLAQLGTITPGVVHLTLSPRPVGPYGPKADQWAWVWERVANERVPVPASLVDVVVRVPLAVDWPNGVHWSYKGKVLVREYELLHMVKDDGVWRVALKDVIKTSSVDYNRVGVLRDWLDRAIGDGHKV